LNVKLIILKIMDFKPVKSGPVFQTLCHAANCDEMSPIQLHSKTIFTR